jgi:hypothetical protein
MQSKSNKLKTVPMFPIGGTVNENMRDYSNEPAFIRKSEEARKTLEKLVLPKELLDKIKKPSAK